MIYIATIWYANAKDFAEHGHAAVTRDVVRREALSKSDFIMYIRNGLDADAYLDIGPIGVSRYNR